MWLFLIADSVYLEGATMSVIEKCSMYERMLSMCERGAASGDLGAKMGIAKYRSKLAALNAVRAMIAGVEPKSNSAASYESRRSPTLWPVVSLTSMAMPPKLRKPPL
jgi:hypothetical protein